MDNRITQSRSNSDHPEKLNHLHSDLLFEANDLHKSFKQQPDVLNGLSLSLQKGDVVHISGANGCGKSTFLKIAAGLMEPDSGTVEKPEETYVGALIENPEFADFLDIRDNLNFLYRLRHKKVDADKIRKLCEDFGLDYSSKKMIRNYSIGMKEKMGIIQAIMEDQNVILLDEPTRGLDEKAVEMLKKKIQELKQAGKAIVIASHDPMDLGYTKRYAMRYGKLMPYDALA